MGALHFLSSILMRYILIPVDCRCMRLHNKTIVATYQPTDALMVSIIIIIIIMSNIINSVM